MKANLIKSVTRGLLCSIVAAVIFVLFLWVSLPTVTEIPVTVVSSHNGVVTVVDDNGQEWQCYGRTTADHLIAVFEGNCLVDLEEI